ncbi:MAG TPA: carbon-nitrogen hydrolase family protein [Candidatus Sumerlaeota bacterium]|nr:carbon-nitrogen hydrolase family protein [Candidatus Sumerlaeota bacterium]
MSRKVKVAAFTTDYLRTQPRTLEQNLDWTCETIDLLAAEAPDIITLTEAFDCRELDLKCWEKAQVLDGPTFTRMAAKAREHHCYIICSFIERRDGRLYNTSAVIDRRGELVGRYDKIHPTTTQAYDADYDGELEEFITPGRTAPTVLQTDFGAIGCQICFDANWHAGWGELKRAGAEIIFFSSAFSAGRILQSIATLYHLPIVAACRQPRCRIIDRDGLIISRQGDYQRWVCDTLDLDNPLFHLDGQWAKMEEIRKRFGPAIKIRVYEEEGWWRIMPLREDLEIPPIIREYGLQTLEEYFAAAERIQDERRAQPLAAPQAKPVVAR